MEAGTEQSQFITTEPLERGGEAGEKVVWEAVQAAFAGRRCLGYWRYPIFSQVGKGRKEPDIFIADFQLGLMVVEVKSITIDRLVNISGHRWEYRDYYTPSGNPYQQAESQLFSLLDYLQNEPSLHRQIAARALVALPAIAEGDWQERGFHRQPAAPPILFRNHLRSPAALCSLIQQVPPLIGGHPMGEEQWKLLLSLLAGTPRFCQPDHRVLSPPQSRGKVLQKLRSQVSEFDLTQEKIGKQIPPGCQRIRGIAGSGKTVLLCQKAAHMHLKHPDWKIALVFFSRSLYETIGEQVDRWLRHFSNQQQGYDPQNRHLLVLHAWGGRKQPGLYSTLCQLAGIRPLTVAETDGQKPNEALAESCLHLLGGAAIPQVFDALLIDEGQDLMADRWKWEDRQPFYWMAYQALRPANPLHPQQRRLIWTYDEAQSLESLKIPTASELFGEKLGHLVTGRHPGGIPKSEILRRCYRTPHAIIVAAHALGMGLLRPQGMLAGPTRKPEWKALGYDVKGRFTAGERITIERPLKNSPHPMTDFWDGPTIEFTTYLNRQEELMALAQNIHANLRHDGLRPSREILVLVLGNSFETMRLENYVASFLMKQGIDIFLPGMETPNQLSSVSERRNPNQFWCEGAVTVSRLYRAKGQEADMVYVVGLDRVARSESDLYLRNQLFVALTRARGWVNLSGIGHYALYEEVRQVMKSGGTFTFTFRQPPQREIHVTDGGELLHRYASGGRNFQNADLGGAELAGVCLNGANFIGANLRKANLQGAQLEGVKFIAADLSQANLSGTSLRGAQLMGATLRGADLSRADLRGADWSDTDLTGTRWVGTKLE